MRLLILAVLLASFVIVIKLKRAQNKGRRIKEVDTTVINYQDVEIKE